MYKYMALTLAGFLISFVLFAQNGGLSGKLIDRTENKPVAGATVSLLRQADSSEVSKTVSSAEGTFSFSGLISDSLIIQVTSVNLQEYISFITLRDTVKTLAPIMMERQNKDLAGVTVISRTPPVIVKGDTSQFSASQFKVNPDATTEDLIKKMPGITVAKDGTVTAQGEQVRKVTIDGKDFFGDDAAAALKNLPSEVVDKIQVFDRLSDQARLTGFDDGNSVKAINVVTKAGIKNGRFGRVYAGYGTDSRYSAGGNSSFFKNNRRLSLVGNFNNINLQNFASQDLLGVTSSNNNNNNRGGGGGGPQGGGGGRFGGGNTGDFNVSPAGGISRTNAAGINYSNVYNKKLTLAGSYFFNNSRNDNASLINTETFLKADTALFTRQNSNTLTDNTNHRLNLRLEYNIDSSNSIFIIPSINFQDNNSNAFSRLRSFYGMPVTGALYDSANNSLSRIGTDRNGFNIRNNILYRHAFAKKGRSLSLGFNTSFSKNNSDNITAANYRYFDTGIFTDSLQNQFYDNLTDGYSIGGTIAYTEPLSLKAQLQFDYNPSVQINHADQKTFAFDGQKYSAFDSVLSNKFDNRITINNGGVTYRYTPGKDEQLSFGLSYQHAQLQSDRIFPSKTNTNKSFSSALPNLIYRKKISASSNIRIFYRASVNFPSVNQLQDVVNNANPLRVNVGNPLLNQSNTHFLGSRYSYTNSKTSKSFFAGVFLQTAADFISNATYIPDGDSSLQTGSKSFLLNKGTQLSKPVNLNGYRTARTFLTYSMPIKMLKTIVNLNAGVNYSRLPGLINDRKTITDNFIYTTGIVLASNINEFVDFNISYAANFNQTSGSVSGKNNYVNQAAGIQLNLLSKQGWFVQNDVDYRVNSGLSEGFNQEFGLWNAAIGKKFLKNRVGELKLSVFDLLKQNQSIVRTVDEKSIQDIQSDVLKQYFMLTFTYNLKNFGTPAKQVARGENREEGQRPVMPRGGGF